MAISKSEASPRHPYESLASTPEWPVIDRAIQELAGNRDLVETTSHEYIVGYLCRALERTRSTLAEPALSVAEDSAETARRRAVLRAAREAIRAANPEGRDLVQELIDERRAEAARD